MVRPEVRDGMEVLDFWYPDWEQAIDLSAFNMMDGTACVIGQRFGSYLDGVRELMRETGRDEFDFTAFAHNHGFNDADYIAEEARQDTRPWFERMFDLESEWRSVIAARQVGL